ncbi:glycosyltransferase family 4 protein [Parahaliea aestuarii]|uniref:Glycosyltransferase family 4 protein n=1 Tax=Parahaliea aestuarii TaxID=1852021 RepID=A0A5C9A4G3_9GAMM|nr:glycosyltransferase family 4 protein [Parahaliea aestuarii]TXS94537.1 glycosyltransferase family 4 protein [Parahaliea aestuarii]
MKLLFVATSYPTDDTDWRGVFIRHLAHALAERDDISLSMWTPPGPLPATAQAVSTPAESAWLKGLMDKGGIAHLMRSGGLAALSSPLRLLAYLRSLYRREQRPDIYHLNWLQTALPLPRSGAPVLMTVLGTDLKLLSLPLVKTALRRVMRRRPVAICPNAEWMAEPLSKAFGDLAIIQPVPFGIDPIWFAIDRQPDLERPQWLAVTRLTKNKLGHLLEWSEPLFRNQQRELHLIGPMQETITLPDWVHYHGAASPEVLARDWFPKAAGLITLSQHAEGRPQVMLEAMAATLPIIASDLPAHRNLVEQGITGSLCSMPGDYAAALQATESPASNQQLGIAAREWVASEIGTWADCAGRYVALYRKLSEPHHD